MGDEDPQLAFVYDEARRGLIQQQAVMDSLLNRAGVLIFAVSFASSLLGSRALTDGLQSWDWVALGTLLLIGALAVVMLWPYYNLWFRFDPKDLLDTYVDTPTPSTLAEMHRDLALRIRDDMRRNDRVLRRIRIAGQLALVLLLIDLLAWMFSIATMN